MRQRAPTGSPHYVNDCIRNGPFSPLLTLQRTAKDVLIEYDEYYN